MHLMGVPILNKGNTWVGQGGMKMEEMQLSMQILGVSLPNYKSNRNPVTDKPSIWEERKDSGYWILEKTHVGRCEEGEKML